jgi:hypothetical protein
MKTTSSYRLSNKAKAKLSQLSEDLGLNHTQVLELVIKETIVLSRPKIQIIIKGEKNGNDID